ncbi:MAG TPA: AI-2E family transporter [Terracidiphilus sp.]|jgi:predicted PurR-regulated permease PerM
MIRTIRSSRSLRSDITFMFVLALACYVAYLVRDVLILLYVSALFAVVLQPLVQFVGSWRIGRFRPFKSSAIFILLVVVLGGLVAFGFFALPPVIRDLEEFGKWMPQRLPAVMLRLNHFPLADRINMDDMAEKIQDLAGHSATYLLMSIKTWAGSLFTIAMGLILTIYFTLEGDSAYRWALSFFPMESRTRLDLALRRAEVRMGKWLIGQGSLMLILGLTSTVVYLALHVRYAYALGVLTGLLNIIPVLGAAVCVVLALLAAAVDSWGRVLGVAVFYLIYLNLENSFLTPRIMKSSVDLPGLAIIVALLLGSALEGVLGALVSVPTAVLVAVLVDEYLVSKDPEPAV